MGGSVMSVPSVLSLRDIPFNPSRHYGTDLGPIPHLPHGLNYPGGDTCKALYHDPERMTAE